jgi:hypothetical protein
MGEVAACWEVSVNGAFIELRLVKVGFAWIESPLYSRRKLIGQLPKVRSAGSKLRRDCKNGRKGAPAAQSRLGS